MQETTHFGDNYDPFKEYEFPPALGAVSTRSNNYSFIPPFDKLVFVSMMPFQLHHLVTLVRLNMTTPTSQNQRNIKGTCNYCQHPLTMCSLIP